MATRAQSETMNREKRFEGKTVAITGPSLHGIGGAIALRLAEEGASLFLLALEKPSELLDRLEAMGCPAEYLVCDVADPQAASRTVDAMDQKQIAIDVLINNAGVDWSSPFHSMDEVRWREIVEVNFVGVLRMSQALLPHLQRRKGVIVNISSATGFSGTVGLAAYGASKAAVNSLTQSLAAEYAESQSTSCRCGSGFGSHADGRALCRKRYGGRLGCHPAVSPVGYRVSRGCRRRGCFFSICRSAMDFGGYTSARLDSALAHASASR